MNLLELRSQYKELQKQAKTLIGSMYYLPLSALESPTLSGFVWCAVKEIELGEDCVEFTYLDTDGEEIWTAISIDEFISLTK